MKTLSLNELNVIDVRNLSELCIIDSVLSKVDSHVVGFVFEKTACAVDTASIRIIIRRNIKRL
jgi:hypothetical protein